ncbi:c4ec5f86-dec6-472e-aff0-4ba1e4c4735f [Sclerotinia trifoliorum]|uniref:C4ec5f86-dec6-472e-aff0-4ba1e4c4735f n=1 Tax=Sclerotinia trifoliorum TaxID=28548 RepID=A0A8H2VRN1_9HELO|nr:c4ec5f86-dec6-472e-aff0-4ba1e4c4735f [Sclerotinia trifoliorum]
MTGNDLNQIITFIHRIVSRQYPNVAQNVFAFILERNVWRCCSATAAISPAATSPIEPLPRANAPPANEASPKASNVALPVRRRPSPDLDENAAADNNVPGAVLAAPPVNSTQAITPMAHFLPKGMVIEDRDRSLEWTQDSVTIRLAVERRFVASKDFRGQPQFGWEPSGYPRFSMITYAINARRAMKGGSDHTL